MTEETEQQGQVATSDEVVIAPVVAKKLPVKRAPAKKAPAKRVRRTNAQIESDEIAELRRKLKIAELRAAAAQAETEEVKTQLPIKASGKQKKIFHFVEDGFTFLGKTWYRGEEVVLVEGSEDWEKCLDRYGNFALNKGDYEQMEAYNGTVFYREGPWPGLPFDPKNIYEANQIDDHGNAVVPSPEEIAIIEKINKQRFKR
jgi:hypothetical protein